MFVDADGDVHMVQVPWEEGEDELESVCTESSSSSSSEDGGSKTPTRARTRRPAAPAAARPRHLPPLSISSSTHRSHSLSRSRKARGRPSPKGSGKGGHRKHIAASVDAAAAAAATATAIARTDCLLSHSDLSPWSHSRTQRGHSPNQTSLNLASSADTTSSASSSRSPPLEAVPSSASPSPNASASKRPAPTAVSPYDPAVQALGLPQSAKPGTAVLTLERDDLVRLRRGHFYRPDTTRHVEWERGRNWADMTLSEAAWTRLEEVGVVVKGRAWTTREAYNHLNETVKPDLPYVMLTKLVIASSPRKMLTLNQIYQAMEERWPFFVTLGQTFRNSIRHNLSMNPAFVNVERPIDEGGLGTGKGGYWRVSDDHTVSHRGRLKRSRSRYETTVQSIPLGIGLPGSYPFGPAPPYTVDHAFDATLAPLHAHASLAPRLPMHSRRAPPPEPLLLSSRISGHSHRHHQSQPTSATAAASATATATGTMTAPLGALWTLSQPPMRTPTTSCLDFTPHVFPRVDPTLTSPAHSHLRSPGTEAAGERSTLSRTPSRTPTSRSASVSAPASASVSGATTLAPPPLWLRHMLPPLDFHRTHTSSAEQRTLLFSNLPTPPYDGHHDHAPVQLAPLDMSGQKTQGGKTIRLPSISSALTSSSSSSSSSLVVPVTPIASPHIQEQTENLLERA